jgi:hypothetical protein
VKQARARSFYKSTVVGGRGDDVERGQGHGVAPCGRLQRLRHRESRHRRGGEGRGREGEALNPGRVRRVFSDPVTAARDRGSRGSGCEQGEQGRWGRTGAGGGGPPGGGGGGGGGHERGCGWADGVDLQKRVDGVDSPKAEPGEAAYPLQP